MWTSSPQTQNLVLNLIVLSNPLFILFPKAEFLCSWHLWVYLGASPRSLQQWYSMRGIAPWQLDGSIANYFGQSSWLGRTFACCWHPCQGASTIWIFYMLLVLYGLPAYCSMVCDKILGSPTIPTLYSSQSTMLFITCRHFLSLNAAN